MESETETEDLGTQKTTTEPIGTTAVPHAETMTTSSSEKSTASVTNDTLSSTMPEAERETTFGDMIAQKTTPKPVSTTVVQLAETTTVSSTERPIVSEATDAFSTTMRVTKMETVMKDFGTQTVSEAINTTVTLLSETMTASSPEKSTISVTTGTPSTSTLVTLEEAKENATETITKGFKAIETSPTPYTTTAHPSMRDSETTTTEDDYLVEENTCIFQGRLFQSAEQIPREDPCEFCFCFRSDIICLQQSCPPPAPGCNKTRLAGFCCPRYDCPVYMTNITQFNRRKGAQVYIQQRRIDKRAIRPTIEVKGCQVNGEFYELGKTVTSASGPCLHCVCQEDGLMHCDPQRCKPQAPLMLKMNNSFFRRR